MPAEATQEVRILLHRLDGEVVDLPQVADARHKLDNLAKRDASPVTTVLDDRREGEVVCGVRTERDLGQRRWGSSG
jgi:hypothetical protein